MQVVKTMAKETLQKQHVSELASAFSAVCLDDKVGQLSE